MTQQSRLLAACELAALRLGQPALGPMISRGQFDRIAEHVAEVSAACALLSTEEDRALAAVLHNEESGKEFAIALNALLHGKRSLEERFVHWIGMLSRHGLATWPVATMWPFLLYPDRYFPVFPDWFSKIAVDGAVDLARPPDWAGYVASQRLAHAARKNRGLDSLLDLWRSAP